MSAPLVRSPEGAILGVDYRQLAIADPSVRVPGVVPARVVMPGDTVRVEGGDVVVLRPVRVDESESVYLVGVTPSGGNVVAERRLEDPVHVVAVGAFG